MAVFRGQTILRHINLDPDQRSAATLAPTLKDTFGWCQDNHHQPAFVSVADGPGSFTGLRIGVTTAKTLCYAKDLPLIAVDSLAAIAAAAFHDNPACDRIWSVIDAYRGQVFMGEFLRSSLLPAPESLDSDWTPHPATTRILDLKAWEALLTEKPPELEVAGDQKPLASGHAKALTRNCDAVGVGLLAIRAAALGKHADPMHLVPRYLKASAAEEKKRRNS